MFNTVHILYMVCSGILTAVLLFLARRYAKDQQTRNFILKCSAIITVAIHYSNLWVDYFASGGSATIENNQILPVYPCNVVMWMLLIAAFLQNKKCLLFQLLGEFCMIGGTVCGVVGIVLNANFDANPTLADYDILKGLLSHSTMLFGCLYMAVGQFVRIRMFNTVSVTAGLGCFVVCGLLVDSLYAAFGMEPPDGMFLRSNPYFDTPVVVLGIGVIGVMFVVFALWELRLPREERWYRKINLRKKHERIIH
jgi:hypothetical protein